MKKQIKRFCAATSALRDYTNKSFCWVFVRVDDKSTTLQRYTSSGSVLELRLPIPFGKPGHWSISLAELEQRLKEPGEAVILGEMMPDTENTCQVLPLVSSDAVTLPPETLEAFRFCWPVVQSAEEGRGHLCQVLAVPSTGKVISTDGHRMHVADIPRFAAGKLSLRKNDFVAILRMATGTKEPLKLQLDGEHLRAQCDGVRLRATLGDSEDFPDYERMIPSVETAPVKVTFDAKKWLKTVPKKGEVKLAVSGTVTVTTELGTVVDLPVSSQSGEVLVGLDASYLADALARPGEMALHITDDYCPVVFEGAGRLAVIATIRLS